jgi:hypothetical protein
MTYTPALLPSRTVPVHVWYPSTSTDGDHPKYQGLFTDELSYDDVPPAPSPWKTGLPVLVHSHGHMGFSGNSARLMCQMASHGWLAVAPTHVGNTLADTPDPRHLSIYVHRPLDIRASLDFVASLPATDPLAGLADLSRVAMSGHSFGSYTAWVVAGGAVDLDYAHAECEAGDAGDCSDDVFAALAEDLSEPRAKVVIPLAGAPNGWVKYGQVKVPALMMDGSLNPVGNETPWAEATHADRTWVDVDGGCHQLFGLGNTVYGDPGCSVLPDEEGFALVNPWVLAYARYHVLADRTERVKGLVEGTTSLSPKVHVQHAAAGE